MLEKVSLSADGSITLPEILCHKYALDAGKLLNVIDLGGGTILLSARSMIVPKLVGEIEELRKNADLSLDDLLDDLAVERTGGPSRSSADQKTRL